MDTKKKEMPGQLPNPGRQWRPKGDPVRVDDHSFFSGLTGEAAIPYGIYDLSADTGWVNVGVDHDTSVFAVASIRRWWQARGRHDYPRASQLLITADAGGSNGYRYRLWKAELTTSCTVSGGTSKGSVGPRCSRLPSQDLVCGLLLGQQAGDGLDGVVHVLAAAEVTGQCPPVLQVGNAVLDPDAA